MRNTHPKIEFEFWYWQRVGRMREEVHRTCPRRSGARLVGSIAADARNGSSLVFGGRGSVDLFSSLGSPGREVIHPIWARAHKDISAVNGPVVVLELCGGAVSLHCWKAVHVFGLEGFADAVLHNQPSNCVVKKSSATRCI